MNRFSAFVLLWLALLFIPTANAETFVVKDIRIEGLQRISAGAVFNVLPLQVGDEISVSVKEVSPDITLIFTRT